MRRFLGILFTSLMFGLMAVPIASASTATEVGDAGNLPATSQLAADPALTRITGTISGNDQDMYQLQVGTTSNVVFGASTATGSDPRLYLFDSTGREVDGNDDCTTTSVESCISLTLVPGTYYLAIAGASVPTFKPSGVIKGWSGPGGPSFNYAISLTSSQPHRRNHAPTASAQTVKTSVNTTVAFTLGASDSDHDPLTYTITTAPLHGNVLCSDDICEYMPDIGFTGQDSLIFTVTDSFGATASAKVTIKVKP